MCVHRTYIVKENHIGSAVSEILRYTQRDTETSCYFIIRIIFYCLTINNLVYDCPVFDGMSDFVRSVASASITAAELLLRNKVNNVSSMASNSVDRNRFSSIRKNYV